MAECDGCTGERFPGIRWPTASNCDNTASWVERCDMCQLQESDDAAASAVSVLTGLAVGLSYPVGSSMEQPYMIDGPLPEEA